MSVSHRMTPQNVSEEQIKKQQNQLDELDADFLDIDKPLPGQNFVCLSFVSPEAAIKERYLWYLKEFLNDLVAPIPQPENMPDLEYKTKLHSILCNKFKYNTIASIWEDFLHSNTEKLDKSYNEEVDYQTSTRGLKIRGTYYSYAEAKRRSQQISRTDKKHNVYIGQVGYWLPWDPNPHEVKEQEYQNKELNNLMKKYQENLLNKEEFFHARNQEKMEAALKKNKNTKRVDEKVEEELKKVRTTVAKKDKILNDALEAQRKQKRESKEQKVAEVAEETIPTPSPTSSEEEHSKVAPLQGDDEDTKNDEQSSNTSTSVSTPTTADVQGDLQASSLFQSSVGSDLTSSVFVSEDPWLQRKQPGSR